MLFLVVSFITLQYKLFLAASFVTVQYEVILVVSSILAICGSVIYSSYLW